MKILKSSKQNSLFLKLAKAIRDGKPIPAGVSSATLSSLKYQLESKALDFIVSANSGNSFLPEMLRLIERIDVLYNRGLFKEASKYVSKLKKIATDTESHSYLKIALVYEGRMIKNLYPAEILPKTNQHLNEVEALKELTVKTDDAFLFKFSVFQLLQSSYYLRRKDARELFAQLSNNSLLAVDVQSLPYSVKIYTVMALVAYYIMAFEFEKALEIQLVLYRHQQVQKEHLLSTKPEEFIGILFNTIVVASDVRNYNLLQQLLAEMADCMSETDIEALFFKSNYLLYKTVYDCRDAVTQDLIKPLNDFLNEHENELRVDTRLNIRLTLAQMHAKIGNYTLAKDLFSKINENYENTDIIDEKYGIFRLLYFMAFYDELSVKQSKEYTYFKSTLNSFYEKVRKDEDYFNLELIFIKFFRKIDFIVAPKLNLPKLKKLHAELEALFNSDMIFLKHIHYHYDFIGWVKDRIDRCG
ncbi:MAG: hypothetical protein KF706_10790 [Chitinophagales bacterium]|nr:hypothetical protein [Chitinophagales bacterium]